MVESTSVRILPTASAAQTRAHAKKMLGSSRYRKLLILSLLGNVLEVTARLLPAQIVGWSVNSLSAHHTVDMTVLLWGLIAANVLLIVGDVLGVSKYFAVAKFARDLRVGLVRAALRIPSQTIEHAGTGDLLSRNANDIEKIIETGDSLISSIIRQSFILIMIVVLALISSPFLALISMTGIISFYPGLKWYLKHSRDAYLQEAGTNATIYQNMSVAVEGAHSIETFSLQNDHREQLHTSFAKHLNACLRTVFLRQIMTFSIEMGMFIPIILWILVSTWGFHHEWFTIGEITTIGLYLFQMIYPLESVLYWVDQTQSAFSGYSRVVGVELVPQPQFPQQLPPIHGSEIVVKDASFSYPEAKHNALNNIDLTIRPGERLAIVGPSGSGKTTLAKLLAGLDFPDSGSITFGGVDTRDIPPKLLRKNISLVTQEHHIFIGTIAENVQIARSEATREEISDALRTIGAHWAFELGLDTLVGSGRHDLSAAQAQHIALARVVLADPKVVLLDEATSLLDPQSAHQAESALSAVFDNRTVIVIAHRLYSAQIADRIAVIDNGKIKELGSHDELLAHNGMYAVLWSAWNTV